MFDLAANNFNTKIFGALKVQLLSDYRLAPLIPQGPKIVPNTLTSSKVAPMHSHPYVHRARSSPPAHSPQDARSHPLPPLTRLGQSALRLLHPQISRWGAGVVPAARPCGRQAAWLFVAARPFLPGTGWRLGLVSELRDRGVQL
ncbi:serine/threonine-protein kinase PINK1, mitochondrial [Platysternon megacephalum]|uniref:Serine/threonine-protein kinase PINK1, mitochondrial n=1 Tax=Platysternon megacephalum TaxID=55544 RepID=A0A4D9EXR8_9SAUR|nr:serine/threonine-protein kinase PINK1, mitochondrial [Platysternon megacephalum]